MVGYFLVLPLIVLFVSSFIKEGFFAKFTTVYHSLLAIFCIVINIIDLELFNQWGSKINAQFFIYLENPMEAMNSSASSPVFTLVIIGLSQFLIFVFINKKLFSFLKQGKINFKWFIIPFLLLLQGLSFLAIRGGVGTIPNNQSVAYFSNNNSLNNASLNSVWNYFYFVFTGDDLSYSTFNLFDEGELQDFKDKLKVEDTSEEASFLKSSVKKPNVVIVVLESWAADVVSCLESKETLTPYFDSLSANGLLFTNCYATGLRTDKGISAVLSGFPAQSDASAIMYPEKSLKMPSLLKEFKGYSSLFVYGGDPSFANMKIYIQNMGFHSIMDKSNFSESEQNSKWGAHDGVMLKKSVDWMNDLKTPFFSTILTLSSHEPFETPIATIYKGKDNISKFKNSIMYSDKSIHEFMEKCKKQEWYNNTVFVFVADHGRETGVKYPIRFHPGFYKIPLLVYSPLLQDSLSGKRDNSLVSQTDIPAIMEDLFSMKWKGVFNYSISPLSKKKREYVYYAYYNGAAVLQNDTAAYYDNISKKEFAITFTDSTKFVAPEITKKAKLYQQTVMEHFFKLSKNNK
jgi:phosphoglycerol transferase MdoB-like AlkP superfamily enzyme